MAIRRILVLGLALIGTISLGVADATAPVSSSPEAVVNGVWKNLLTQCGQSWFYAGSFFDRGGMMNVLGAGDRPDIYEFRDVKFHAVPIRVSDAERLNGLEYHARVSMMAHIYREAGGTWLDGADLQMRDTQDIFAQALRSVNSDAGQMGAGGVMIFDLQKVKGEWLIARGSENLSGSLTFGGNYYEVSRLGQSVPHKSCAVLGQSIQQKAAADAAEVTKNAHDNAVANAWRSPNSTRDPKRGIPFRLLSQADFEALYKWYDSNNPHQGGDAVFLPAQAIVNSYPIVPTKPDEWLPPGTKIKREELIPILTPSNGYNKRLIVISILAGPHGGEHGIIEAANYGLSDYNQPSEVFATDADAGAADKAAQAIKRNKLEAERVPIRDPRKGILFGYVEADELDAIKTFYRANQRSMAKDIEDSLAGDFPLNDPFTRQWLAPGTTFESVLTDPSKPSSHFEFWTTDGGKMLIVVHVTSGSLAGRYVTIELANYSSNIQVVCPPNDDQLSCGPVRTGQN